MKKTTSFACRNWLPLVAVGAAAAASAWWLAAHKRPQVPQGVEPVGNFDVERYTGKWYEVARIEHRFEKNLVRTRAEYSLEADGSLRVKNRGFSPGKRVWKEVTGRAQFLGGPSIASLKVAFFGPVYTGYHVVALDEDYRWAMVIGDSLDYFWILSRTTELPSGVRHRLLKQARALGVDMDKVLWVLQDGINPTGS